MKRMLTSIYIISIILMISCDGNTVENTTENITKEDLLGYWYPVNAYGDAILFTSDSAYLYGGPYIYHIEGDSILFEYVGPLSIPAFKSKYYFELYKDKSILIFINKNRRILGRLDKNEFIRNDLKDEIIGSWINVEDKEDIITFSNATIERSNKVYPYDFKMDNIKICEEAPCNNSRCTGKYYFNILEDSLILSFDGCEFQEFDDAEAKFVKAR